MNLPYALRLICLTAVVTGLMAAALEGLLAAGAGRVLRLLRGWSARQRERALFRIQMAPLTMALLLAGAVCVPEYVRYEPRGTTEGVSGTCVAMAGLALLWLTWRVPGALLAVLRTAMLTRVWRRTADETRRGVPVVTVERAGATVALAGLTRPVILVSREARETLSEAAMEVALDHERAHAAHGDNWKLLALRLLPRMPWTFTGGGRWMRLWQEAAEWAADDAAAGGVRERRLLLAETLVRVARAAGAPGTGIIQTALSCGEAELAARVERLVGCAPRSGEAGAGRWVPAALLALAAGVASAAAAAPWVYEVSERILHLG